MRKEAPSDTVFLAENSAASGATSNASSAVSDNLAAIIRDVTLVLNSQLIVRLPDKESPDSANSGNNQSFYSSRP